MKSMFLGRTALWGFVREIVLGFLCMGIVFSLRAQEAGFRLEGIESRTLPVTGRKMTNVIFPVAIAAGVRVSKDVLVQKVKGVENVIELKALRRDFPPTNLSVYGRDGRLYSFVLRYVDDTAILNFRVVGDGDGVMHPVRLTGWPVDPETLRASARIVAARRGFLHRWAAADGLLLGLTGVYLRDSLLWLCLQMKDLTGMGFSPGFLRIYSEERKKLKRTASQEVELSPVYCSGFGIVPGNGRLMTAVGLYPFVVGRGRRLVVSVADPSGERVVVLKVKGKVLLRVRRG
ncbi:DUF4138 domain-containing protein [Flavitalea sp. BT771]|uniref:DUF4138 domain-containing protein n=1 Tax=Flavitalea sp. BT771 TaxID=3063329 RepID=UPI0026E466FE|nr:DUF4138 domain-containing protein [Flavitalea sp. BT771]MDO6431571.1 DUF4138 domain-containing protein [Flavitalea sp. BT771]MDV6220479.1 DUF4138 domain-containing protein [Flavitalea sp. BT771]